MSNTALSDFNDLALVAGIQAVTNVINHAILNPNVISKSSANDETAHNAQHQQAVQADDMKLHSMLKRYAQITDVGKVTNKVYDLVSKIEYTKTQFAHEIGNKSLAEQWWNAEHKKISKAEVSKHRDELLNVEAQSMLERYYLIYGTKEVWDNVERIRLTVDTVKLARPNEYELWLKSDKRLTVKTKNIWFDPTCSRSSKEIHINTYNGLPLLAYKDLTIKQAEQQCQPILKLLNHLCEYDNDIFNWVLRWLAIPIQTPGTKMDTTLIFHGEIQGAGKSLFFDRIMSKIYGDYAVTLGQGQLESQYNDWVEGKLWAVFEEIFTGQDRYRHMGMIKQLITGDNVYINKKFMSGWKQENYVNVVFLSNDIMPLSLEQMDRRHVVCYPKTKIPETIKEQISQALNDPDDKMIRAFYTLLLNIDTNGQTSHTPAIMTESKRKLIKISQPNWEIFYDEWKSEELNIPYCTCLSDDLYFVYQQWCRRNGERPTTKTKMMTYVGRHEHKARYHYQNTYTATKKATLIVINLPSSFPNKMAQTRQEWLGDQVKRFKYAINQEFLQPKPND